MTTHHFTVGATAPKGSVYDLPARSLIADESGRAYRVTEGHTADPFDAGETRDLQIMDDQGPVTVLSIPGEELYADQLDALPVGAYVIDCQGDLWRRADMPTAFDSLYAAAFVLCTQNIGERFGDMVPLSGGDLIARSARSLIDDYGPVLGASTEPGAIRAKGYVVPGVMETVDGEDLSHFFAPDEPDARPAVTPEVAHFYGAGPGETVRLDLNDPSDPDTADHSLDLDDLYRATSATIVVDDDGDLWRRQAYDEGRLVWVLVVEDGDPKRGDAMGSTSERLSRLFGPIAYAPADDVKAALSLIPREVVGVLGLPDAPSADPAPAPDADAVVERALDRARVELTGDGEHVAVAISRDADGRVHLRTEVTEKVTGGDD